MTIMPASVVPCMNRAEINGLKGGSGHGGGERLTLVDDAADEGPKVDVGRQIGLEPREMGQQLTGMLTICKTSRDNKLPGYARTRRRLLLMTLLYGDERWRMVVGNIERYDDRGEETTRRGIFYTCPHV